MALRILSNGVSAPSAVGLGALALVVTIALQVDNDADDATPIVEQTSSARSSSKADASPFPFVCDTKAGHWAGFRIAPGGRPVGPWVVAQPHGGVALVDVQLDGRVDGIAPTRSAGFAHVAHMRALEKQAPPPPNGQGTSRRDGPCAAAAEQLVRQQTGAPSRGRVVGLALRDAKGHAWTWVPRPLPTSTSIHIVWERAVDAVATVRPSTHWRRHASLDAPAGLLNAVDDVQFGDVGLDVSPYEVGAIVAGPHVDEVMAFARAPIATCFGRDVPRVMAPANASVVCRQRNALLATRFSSTSAVVDAEDPVSGAGKLVAVRVNLRRPLLAPPAAFPPESLQTVQLPLLHRARMVVDVGGENGLLMVTRSYPTTDETWFEQPHVHRQQLHLVDLEHPSTPVLSSPELPRSVRFRRVGEGRR